VRLQLIQRFVNAHSALFFNDEAFHDETYLGQICSREITLLLLLLGFYCQRIQHKYSWFSTKESTSKLTNFKEKILKYFDCEDAIKETNVGN